MADGGGPFRLLAGHGLRPQPYEFLWVVDDLAGMEVKSSVPELLDVHQPSMCTESGALPSQFLCCRTLLP